jgi:hypothetical protein
MMATQSDLSSGTDRSEVKSLPVVQSKRELRTDGLWDYNSYTKDYYYFIDGELAITVTGIQFYEATQHQKFLHRPINRERVLEAIVHRAMTEARTRLSAVGDKAVSQTEVGKNAHPNKNGEG